MTRFLNAWCIVGFFILAGTASSLAETATGRFRGVWADVFKPGFRSQEQIDEMIGRAVQGNYNALIPEVLAYHDNESGSHGAFWNSSIIPKSTYIRGDFDPLAYMCEQAHANGLEVHPWLVSFRVSTSWPPPGNAYLASRPQWIMVPKANMGGGPVTVGGKYTLDPGSPEVQEYLISIVRELVQNYEIDGIHWDYIRYTQTDAGYPADATYASSSLARFRRISGRPDTPAPDDSAWSDFRRRTISELIRRCQAEVSTVSSNPRQPLRHTAALICFGDAPDDFTNSAPYNLFQDWRLWLEKGWLDAGIPMNYKREHVANQAQWYRNWIDAALGWRYQRHLYCGQANYLNSKANSIKQLQYVEGRGAEGSVNYSYFATADDDLNRKPENDWTWYEFVAAHQFTQPVPTPSMPWRDPATATNGTIYGQVFDADTRQPIDNATVQVGSLDPVQTDGNGYYVATMIAAAASGTDYDVNARQTGFLSATRGNVRVAPGEIRRKDFYLGINN